MKLFGIGGKRAALATTATLALAIGMIATPQAANAEVCLMVRTGNQFSLNVTENTRAVFDRSES